MLFSETPGVGDSVWAGAAVAAVGIGYAVVRLWFYFRGRQQTERSRYSRELAEQQRTIRRDAAQEAWEVVDRLTKEIESHSVKIRELQERHDEEVRIREERERAANERAARCEREHGETRGRLIVIESWARQRGLKIPPPLSDGSSPHQPLAGEGDDRRAD